MYFDKLVDPGCKFMSFLLGFCRQILGNRLFAQRSKNQQKTESLDPTAAHNAEKWGQAVGGRNLNLALEFNPT